ncbi:MAG: 5-(carboxyamino)imidazole ribonucleotide synthase [Balneolales bacterium]|nr:5-(carboxyamino)imidazole ribonucleotide synthase [Balneolales bacterium]
MTTHLKLESGKKIGIIGGGQLARMSAYAAFRYGLQVGAICSPSGSDPMEQITPHIFRGGVSDYDTLMKLARWADVITLENEFLDADILQKVQDDSGTPVFPSPETFRLIENKRIEKETFRDAGIPVAEFVVLKSENEIEKVGAKLGWPFIMKSSKGGYDGYGNAKVSNRQEALKAFSKLGGEQGREIIAERMVPFTNELAVMVAINEHGAVAYPCCETIQESHICKEVHVPAGISRSIRDKTCEIAIKAAKAINGKGLFGFEFFLTRQNEILLNESAPRPHNSGHYSIEACNISQFESHIRAVLGLPLVEPKMRFPQAVMINLLGKRKGNAVLEWDQSLTNTTDREAHLHVYGKKDSRPGRKMGHITLLGNNAGTIAEEARKLEQSILL